MNEIQKLSIKNDNAAPKLIVLEPWAAEYVLLQGETVELVFSERPITVGMTMEQWTKEGMYTKSENADSSVATIDTIVLWVEGGLLVEVNGKRMLVPPDVSRMKPRNE